MLMGNPFWFPSPTIFFYPDWCHYFHSKIAITSSAMNVLESIKPGKRKKFLLIMSLRFCWYVQTRSDAKRKEKNWGLFRVGFLTLKKTCLRRHQHTRRAKKICCNNTHEGRQKKRNTLRKVGCVSVHEKMEKSTGCVGSRARLMPLLGMVVHKIRPKRD